MKKIKMLRNVILIILMIYITVALSGCTSQKDIVIYQTVDGVKTELYRELFTSELEYHQIIENHSIYYENKHQHGYNIVEIKNGKANVIESNCPNGLCLSMTFGNKSIVGSVIVCAPNKLEIVMEPHQ